MNDTYIEITDFRGVKMIAKLPITIRVVLAKLSAGDFVDANGVIVTALTIDTGQSVTLQYKGKDQLGDVFPVSSLKNITFLPANPPVRATILAPDRITFLGLAGASAGNVVEDFSVDVS